MTEPKICPACGLEKPLLEFYSSGRPKADGSPGYSTNCKECTINARKRRWDASGDRREQVRLEKVSLALKKGLRSTRICRTCGEEKPTSEFYLKRILACGAPLYRPDCSVCNKAAIANNPKERERIRSATAQWRSTDLDRARKSARDSHTAHKKERNATKAVKRADPKTRPGILAVEKKSRIRNAVTRRADTKAHREANAEHYKTYAKSYWKSNPNKASEYHSRRRTAKVNSEGTHTAADIADIRRQQKGKCAICGKSIKGEGAVDHIVALVNGGSNGRRNLQIVHKRCNSMKRSKDPITFMQSLGFLL